MTQKNLFINYYEDDDDALSFDNLEETVKDAINKDKIGVVIPFPKKIKMSEEDFKRLTYYLKNNCGKLALSLYGMSAEQTLLLTLEFYLGNDLHKFVDIVEPKHAYRIKKELEGKLSDFDEHYPFLDLDNGYVCSSSINHEYSRSEFEALPKQIQALFTEVE
ncbi:hypothetical protein [Oenococcus sicerae]|uniref:hypothetical protein n=1 Tax=Oenococcus sicerae TaxID=2203724 RepID=UPI0039EABA56